MIRLTVVVLAALLATACQRQQAAGPQADKAGDAVWVAGSSTVFPFATRVSENVARLTGNKPARVESLGTGGGIKLFCSGLGAKAPDIATASRQMKKSEWDACVGAGVNEIIELKVGYDGIVIANAKGGKIYDVTREQIFRALAAELPAGAGFAPNTTATWADVNPSLPKDKILVYGPPPTSGTRDAFAELALEAGARKLPALEALRASDEDAFKQRAHRTRGDGAWVDAGENDNAIVQTLTKTPGSLGVFGYSFLENNSDTVKAASVEGVAPTLAAISNGSYPLSRSLYIYVKKANFAVKPGLREYVQAFVSDAASGKGGYLIERGLIPLPDAERLTQQAHAKDQQFMAAPEK